MATVDHLSALVDDLLLHILSFVPARDAAASTSLSHRWQTLWRSISFLNLDTRPYSAYYASRPFDDFFRNADTSLRGSKGLEGLRLFLVEDAYRSLRESETKPEDDTRVAGLLANPAASWLKQLIIACEQHHYERQYSPPLASLPCAATLRMLELHRCYLEPQSTGGLTFPSLTDLTLHDCTLLDGYLQVVIAAAPALTSLLLLYVRYKLRSSFMYKSDCFGLPLRLRCPTVTALVLRTYVNEKELQTFTDVGIELDMPRLRSFIYQGYPVKLSLTSPAPGLERVDFDDTCRQHYMVPAPRVLTSFSSTRVLKMCLISIENIVADGVTLPTFPNLVLLELAGKFGYRNSKTAEVVVGLLHSCPVLSELHLRLDMQYDYHYEKKTKDAVGGSFAESMGRFEGLASMSASHRSAIELGEVSQISAALTNGCAFICLETSLRKVTLQFNAKEVNDLQVQLAKFLVENAMVLEEMYIDDDGSQFWPDHLHHKVARWRAESFRRKNLPATTAGFRVYQLANPVVDSKEQT